MVAQNVHNFQNQNRRILLSFLRSVVHIFEIWWTVELWRTHRNLVWFCTWSLVGILQQSSGETPNESVPSRLNWFWTFSSIFLCSNLKEFDSINCRMKQIIAFASADKFFHCELKCEIYEEAFRVCTDPVITLYHPVISIPPSVHRPCHHLVSPCH